MVDFKISMSIKVSGNATVLLDATINERKSGTNYISDRMIISEKEIFIIGSRSSKNSAKKAIELNSKNIIQPLEKGLLIYSLVFDRIPDLDEVTVVGQYADVQYVDYNLKTWIGFYITPDRKMFFPTAEECMRLYDSLKDSDSLWRSVLFYWLRAHFNTYEGDNFLYLWTSTNAMYDILWKYKKNNYDEKGTDRRKIDELCTYVKNNGSIFTMSLT